MLKRANIFLSDDFCRFATGADAEEEDLISVKKLEEIWAELGGGGGGVEQMGGPVKFTALSQHPHIQDIIAACYTYKFPVSPQIITN